ncbi:MAG: hypothetical protein PHS14_03825 [Elusimicrobia bacterium]|nr:hypothetical protein [Elusimicrobiota bacterium]
MNAERARVAPETFVAAALAAFIFALLGGAWARGLSAFWIDLTYLHHGWHSAPAMLVAAGRAPLWEPSLYFGMPMAASMQGGLFYPPTIFYYLFGFATATALFQAFHLFTAGWLCALWLRACRLSWGASLGGALIFAFGGVMIARLPFLNHLATLAWAPALALFFRRPVPLALALALMVLAGYPTFIPGCAAAAWVAACAARSGRWSWAAAAGGWAKAALLSGFLAAAQLLPGFELAAFSRRSAGVGLAEAMTLGFAPHDLLQWIGPLALGIGHFHPSVDWTLCVYLGAAGAAAAACGAGALPRRRALVLAAAVAAVVLLTLGSSNPLSAALWTGEVSPLRFVRYPGNLAYIAMLPLAALAAAGFSGRRAGPALVLLSALELLAVGRAATPMAPRGLYTEPGPLVRTLQAGQGGARYLISPKALEASKGSDAFDWKQRLYGLTNAPYRLRSAANFGEPLVPAPSYAVMDALLSLPSADAAAGWMPWIGASRLLTPEPARSPRLTAEPRALWEISKVRGPVSIAYQLTPKDGAALPAVWPPAPPDAERAPLEVRREREDRFEVSGEGAGWAYVAEPRFPGWRTVLAVPGGERDVIPYPALGAFQKVETPAGSWTLRWRYEPGPWRLGLLLACFSWIMLAWSWYHRAVASGETR